MKILFIAPANSVHTMRWVNALEMRGHEMHLVSLADHCTQNEQYDKKVYIHALPVAGTKGYYLNALVLRRIAKEVKPDVINAHYASGYGTLMRMAGLKRGMLSVWGSDVYQFPYQSPINMKILKKNLNYANSIASTSNCMAEQTLKVLGVERDINITPFGVQLNKFPPKQQAIEKSIIVIGCIKSLEFTYGIDTLIYAIKNLKELLRKAGGMYPEVVCRIYGEGSQREELESLISELGMEDSITLMGKIPHEEVPIALKELDVFCCLSRSESFGVSIIEAAACGLPVVVSDTPGFMEVVKDNESGKIVPIDNASLAAQALKELVVDTERRERMGNAGRKIVEERYDWEKNVTNMEQIYINLMQ